MKPFSRVNRIGTKYYLPGYQRHHLIPLQVATISELSGKLSKLIPGGFDFDDFNSNGIFLPGSEAKAKISGFPLHRGPHPQYNQLVIDRLMIISRLSDQFDHFSEQARFFVTGITSLQNGLRRGLVKNSFKNMTLNRRDPTSSNHDFSKIDDQIDNLYHSTNWPLRKQ